MKKIIPLITGAGLAVIIAGCGAVTPHYILKPSAAMAIVNRYNAENAMANKTLNQTLENENETGLSAQIDDASYQMLKLQGKDSAGNGDPFVWHVTNYVFNQASYPAYFLAVATPLKSHLSNFFLFVKASAKAPWKVDFEPAGPANLLPPLVSAGGGYYAAGPVEKTSVSPSNAFSALSNYWNSYNTPPGVGANLFVNGPWTSGTVNQLGANSSHWDKTAPGATYGFNSSVDITPIVIFKAKGGVLAFGGLDTAQEYSEPSNYYTTQDVLRKYYSPFLTPGQYSNITVNYIYQLLIYIPVKGKMVVVGGYGGNVSASGTPFSPTN